jgi:sirohydrochlorin ferrochelatase
MKVNADAVILLGHGSRVGSANTPLAEMAKMISARLGGVEVEIAFLQLAQPTLEKSVMKAYEKGARKIAVMPFFLFSGAHVLEDIPGEIERLTSKLGELEIILCPHLGLHPRIAEAAAERILEAL